MMNLNLALVVALILSSGLQLFAQQQDDNRQFYTICIGTFLNARIGDFVNLREHGFLYDETSENSMSKIHIGGFHDSKKATTLLESIRQKGYQDAYIVSRPSSRKGYSYFIQLAIINATDQPDWSKFVSAKPLFVHLDDSKVKILSRPYKDKPEADQSLSTFRNLGFADAFVRRIAISETTEITDFETGGLLKTASQKGVPLDISETYSPSPDSVSDKQKEPPSEISDQPDLLLFSFQDDEKKENAKDKDQEVAKQEATPRQISQEKQLDSAPLTETNSEPTLPAIRGNIARQSVKDLQSLLKQSGTYTEVIDGLYGPATAKAIQQILRTNKQIQKYQILSNHLPPVIENPPLSELDQAILSLPTDPKFALSVLGNDGSPLAIAYIAYAEYTDKGPSIKVDDQMHRALSAVFRNQSLESFPFDPSATYAYRSLDQLILHLSYIQKLSSSQSLVPCWLFHKHPTETLAAFRSAKAYPKDYRIEPCDPFLEWEPLKLLRTMAADFCPEKIKSTVASVIQNNAAKRTKIYLTPAPVNPNDRDEILAWNHNLWKKLSLKEKEGTFFEEQLTAFGITYQQCRVLIEDSLINKGLQPEQADTLSLLVLHTIVDPYLRYLTEPGSHQP